LRPGEWSTFSRAQLADLDEYIAGSHLAHGNVLNSHLYNGDLRSLIENARGGTGDDLITGNDGANLLVGGAGLDKLEGLDGDDRLKGDAGGDSLYGADGLDRLKGGAGGDLMFGGGDADVIQGNTGADTLNGGGGADRLSGGSQGDTFVFRGRFDADVVTDFAVTGAPDVIQFGVEVFSTFSDVQAALSQVGADVLIEAGWQGNILLTDVQLEELTKDHFAFVS
jgi:serralysin